MTVTIKNKYRKLYTTNKRYIIVTGGRGSGKTFAVQDFAVRLLEQVGQGILYTRYTMTSVEKTIIPLFRKHIELISDPSKYHITKNIITNKETGAFIMFSGIKTSSGDQTANLKTLPNITTWIVEEGEDYNDEKSFEDIDDSIRTIGMQNRVIWVQNPSTRHHFIFQRFFQFSHVKQPIRADLKYKNYEGKIIPFTYQKSTHPDVEHIHTTYFDNEDNLDQGKIRQWNSTLNKNPKKWENKYGGAWIDLPEGVIFDNVNWLPSFPEDCKRISFGMDFGFTNDPTTLVKCGVSDGELFAERWIYDYAMTTKDIDNALKELQFNPRDVIYADAADPKTIKELRLLGWKIRAAKKGPDSIRHGIDAIKKYEALNIVNCEYWKTEQISYIWGKDRKTSKPTNKPIDDYNHLWDALRYGIQGLKKKAAATNYRN